MFLPIVTRETPGLLPKPDPAGILHIANEWGLDSRGENLIMVGLSFAFQVIFSSLGTNMMLGW